MEIISPSYHPAQAATYGGDSLRPLLNTPIYDERYHFAGTVQPFRAGGYEVTLRSHDLQQAADRVNAPRRYGKREEPGERSQDSLNVARQRAKATVRKRIKDMGGNRLCTLTVRQNDALGFMSPEDWALAFARFVRFLRRHGLMNDYVAVLEPHKKGLERLAARRDTSLDGHGAADGAPWDIPLHMHFVTRSEFKMPINLMRKGWALASDRDSNIDVQFLKVRHDSDSAIDKVASYASKYITKGLAEFERFNKKRYWAAGEPLLPKGRVWLRSRDMQNALNELVSSLGMTSEEFGELIFSRHIFIFPNNQGAWLNVRPSGLSPPPPF